MESSANEESLSGSLAVANRLSECPSADFRSAIAAATNEELKAELARLLGFTADALVRMALITHELEQRGEDLASIKVGLLPILRQIAAGTLHPQIVVMFAGSPKILQRISKIPYSEQQEIVDGSRVVNDEPIQKSAARTPARRIGRDSESGPPSLINIAESADHKDLGEMIGMMILQSKKPDYSMKSTLLAVRGKLGEKANTAIDIAIKSM